MGSIMNERIKLLAVQARINVSQKNYGYYWIESADGIEKFAELIVKECIDINKQELSFNAFETLMNRYQKHFGVGE